MWHVQRSKVILSKYVWEQTEFESLFCEMVPQIPIPDVIDWLIVKFLFSSQAKHLGCAIIKSNYIRPLHWRHNDHDGVSNHQPHGCFTQSFIHADQVKHQSPHHWPVLWGIHWDRWIPRTKGQLRGKRFHLMTSSCSMYKTQYNISGSGHRGAIPFNSTIIKI